jgi:phage terminase large subunit GpA-like protein
VTANGRKLKRGYKVWPVGASIAKTELYGWLGLRIAEGEPPPDGYCHFPEYGEDYFKELTAEHLVTVSGKKGRLPRREWRIQPGRENHFLDCRVLARAAAAVQGIDRVGQGKKARGPRSPAPSPSSPPPQPPSEAPTPPPARTGYWQGGGRPRGGGGGWLRRRR